MLGFPGGGPGFAFGNGVGFGAGGGACAAGVAGTLVPGGAVGGATFFGNTSFPAALKLAGNVEAVS